jgi:hypothetical protein
MHMMIFSLCNRGVVLSKVLQFYKAHDPLESHSLPCYFLIAFASTQFDVLIIAILARITIANIRATRVLYCSVTRYIN